jgi:hypothetical protein
MRLTTNDRADSGSDVFTFWLTETKYGVRTTGKPPVPERFEHMLTDLMHCANREGWDFEQMIQKANLFFRLELVVCDVEFEDDDLKNAYMGL